MSPPSLTDRVRIALVRCLKWLLGGVRFRGKGTILWRLCPPRGTITIDVFGYAMECDLSERIQRTIFLFDYDKEALAFIREQVKPGDTFIDVGANVGFYTLLAARLVGPQGRVVAIEPNPKTNAKLEHSLKRNGLSHVTLLKVALGKERGVARLSRDSKSGNDSASLLGQGGPESVDISVVTLDEVAVSQKLGEVAYMKVDVDGFEPNVFAGAQTLLRERRFKAIQCEFCDYWLRQNGSNPEALHATLLAAGYRDKDGTPAFATDCIVDRILVRA